MIEARHRSRIDVLDSLRGIAASLVVLGHFLNLIPGKQVLAYTPLLNAHASVIFFFLLSGFVLALPYVQPSAPSYAAYLIKRICRIYLPYLGAVAAAMLACAGLSRGGIPELGPWFNSVWATPLTWGRIVDHVLLLGSFENHVYDPVLWSLVHELRISLIFPFVCVGLMRLDWRLSLGLGAGASVLGIVLGFLSASLLHWPNDFFDSLHYLAVFILGMVLAKHREPLVRRFAARPRRDLLLCFALGFLLFSYARWAHVPFGSWRLAYLDDWLIALGAAIMLLTALASPDLTRALTIRPLRALGEISYSLYLYHAIVLFSCAYLLHGVLPTLPLLGLALVAALIVAYAAWYAIERPAMALGRWAAGHIKRHLQPLEPGVGSVHTPAVIRLPG